MHTKSRFFALACALIFIAACLVNVGLAQSIILAVKILLLGAVLAYFLNFTLQIYEKAAFALLGKRKLSVAISYAGGVISLIVLVYVFAEFTLPGLGREVEQLINNMPSVRENLDNSNVLGKVFCWLYDGVQTDVLRSYNLIFSSAENLGINAIRLAVCVATTGLVFLLNKRALSCAFNGILNKAKEPNKTRFLSVVKGTDALMKEYFNVRVMLGGIIGVVYLFLFQWFGVPYPILLSSVSAVLTLCPYVGAFLPVICAVILDFLYGGTVNFLLILAGIASIFAFELFLSLAAPSRLNLTFFDVIICAVAGCVIGGIVGIILFPILGAICKHIAKSWLSTIKTARKF